MKGDWHWMKSSRRDTLLGWVPHPCPPAPPNLASVMSIVPSCGTWAHLRFCHQPCALWGPMSPSGASVLTKPGFPILQLGRLGLQPTAWTREESQEAVLLEGRG